MLTLLHMKLTFIVMTVLILSACTPATKLPDTVIIDAGAPLECSLLDPTKTIDQTTAQYNCQAPGAFLESINTKTMTAQYFTANTQGDTVTSSPSQVTIISIENSGKNL